MTTRKDTYTVRSGELQFSFLNSGDIKMIGYNHLMINQMISNPFDGSFNNLFLRIHDNDGITSYPLLGIKSASLFSTAGSQVRWEGTVQDISYTIIFTLHKHVWFWDVKVKGSNKKIDIIYGQDLGLADMGAVRSNEAYVSQYIDHKVFASSNNGYVVCSRQNQPASTGFPYLQQGSLTKAIGYSTDGFQFFGKSYKETNQPEALKADMLANEIYQYEFAYTALQSEKVELSSEDQFVFYGLFKENHPDAIYELEFENEVLAAWNEIKEMEATDFVPVEKVQISATIGEPLKTVSLSKEEINKLYPTKLHEEYDGDQLLAFFTPTREHIVLKEKELLVERPHGHILMSGNNVETIEEVITTTSYMYGVFNSQLVIGNTSMNKFISNTRNALNVLKTSGQRLYVNIDGSYHLFTMPSLFEIGFNYARWYYKTENETFVITNFTTLDSREVQLHVQALSGKAYNYLVTNQVTMNGNEYHTPFVVEESNGTFLFTSSEGSDNKHIYPDLAYRVQISGSEVHIADERLLTENNEPNAASIALFEVRETADWNMIIQGSLNGSFDAITYKNEQDEIERYRLFFAETMNRFQLSLGDSTPESIEKFNTLAWWYTHNMLVHYSVPHGLEQYGGAAWGTRDVCQGPVEYFMATQKFTVVKEVLKTVYANQYADDGNWPQWFMFDKYQHIRAGESHGDIIVWPLKVLSDYLLQTKDYSILKEEVPYIDRSTAKSTETTATIFDHVKKEIEYIQNHFLHDTYLSSYGDGDWDDTLQPADAQLKQFMASSWTIALTYQSISQYALALEKFEEQEATQLHAMAKGIKADFHKYMMPNHSDIVPGFLYMESPNQPEKMLHPEDTKTGIQYRLLPMQQSIISELFDLEQAEAHYEIIKENLYHPDGVRLMNRPSTYTGGVSKHFKRAEQASNFGREIGLQYVHAHIRFIEAMAKLGKSDEAWRGLEVINPVNIKQAVANADYRQSNSYFSSSDGKFNTRYEAQENFDKLRTGDVPVKAGWRIYSSGPGIYMNQLISNVLGIRILRGNLVIDPVLPKQFDGLHFHFEVNGKPVTFIYNLQNNEQAIVINNESVPFEQLDNIYRNGGFVIDEEVLHTKLNNDRNIIEISL
ncbi:cellobiose phosphorylase [Caldibacillus lycopersici]|uniref:Cellobiose phosphorylase n=1 Tax=Perspicuibacillus lycopersici TaxID=1325689 RepID=A0AAE3LM79_9BACI|nr:cellobiose phosphorylase [Perspicuibacillus lycopersici]MCU9612671.1 cellobiose phosphorylase [Perspicuibacillus lycopersici]